MTGLKEEVAAIVRLGIRILTSHNVNTTSQIVDVVNVNFG